MLFCLSYSSEYAGTLCFFVVIIHCYRELFTYSTPTEVIPAYLSLVVNCFEAGSVCVVDLRVIEGLETMD